MQDFQEKVNQFEEPSDELRIVFGGVEDILEALSDSHSRHQMDRSSGRQARERNRRIPVAGRLFDREAEVAIELVRELDRRLESIGRPAVEEMAARLPSDDRHIERLLTTYVQVGNDIPAWRTSLRLMAKLVNRISTPNVVFFLRVAGYDDIIIKENHGSGYHFHYCDKKKRRSDTILTFDDSKQKILFYEGHGVEKSTFYARPGQWGLQKKKSVYDACMPVWIKMNGDNFKIPGSNATILYP
jgi:hypothetical protein